MVVSTPLNVSDRSLVLENDAWKKRDGIIFTTLNFWDNGNLILSVLIEKIEIKCNANTMDLNAPRG